MSYRLAPRGLAHSSVFVGFVQTFHWSTPIWALMVWLISWDSLGIHNVGGGPDPDVLSVWSLPQPDPCQLFWLVLRGVCLMDHLTHSWLFGRHPDQNMSTFHRVWNNSICWTVSTQPVLMVYHWGWQRSALQGSNVVGHSAVHGCCIQFAVLYCALTLTVNC